MSMYIPGTKYRVYLSPHIDAYRYIHPFIYVTRVVPYVFSVVPTCVYEVNAMRDKPDLSRSIYSNIRAVCDLSPV